MNAWILLLPICLPIVCGLLLLIPGYLQRPAVRRTLLGAALALQTAWVVLVALQPDVSFTLFYVTDKLPLTLRVDAMARIFSVLSAVMFLAVGIYSFEYMKHEQNERRFFLFYLIVSGMLSGLAYSGNMMTLYLFLEAITLFSVPLVLHTRTKEAIAAAFKYLFYSVGGASLALVGFFFVYTYGSTLEFMPGGVLDASKLAGNETAMLVATLVTIVGFGAKAGMFPLHAWLPAAHPVAPAPASAVLSGVITKAGIFATMRFVFQLVGTEFIRNTFVQYTWIVLALFAVLMGSVLAYREPLLKTRLAYSSISQVSYIQFGLATLTAAGVLGGTLHMVFHSIMKDALFMAAGVVIYKTGTTRVDELHGLGKRMPVTIWCFTLLGVALVGIPPAGGFVSKWQMAVGALSSNIGIFTWLGPAVLLLSALLTAGYLFPISISAFFSGGTSSGSMLESTKTDFSMLFPLVILTAFTFLLGMLPGGLGSLLSSWTTAAFLPIT